MTIDIPAMLRDLARIADQLGQLTEWRKLARREQRRPFPTSFDFDRHLDEEMLDLQICFADADFSLREMLKRSDLGVNLKQREQWLEELQRLERRVHLPPRPAGL